MTTSGCVTQRKKNLKNPHENNYVFVGLEAIRPSEGRSKNHHQFGNIKGSSTVHYLVDLINYITSNVDKRLEVTIVAIDLRKAFDLIDHTALIKKMIPLGFHEAWVKWISLHQPSLLEDLGK
nr:uncharacterized protein LOC113811351 [Penaeus vannamei]